MTDCRCDENCFECPYPDCRKTHGFSCEEEFWKKQDEMHGTNKAAWYIEQKETEQKKKEEKRRKAYYIDNRERCKKQSRERYRRNRKKGA